MPIYKVGNHKKEGLQKYYVRINYIADNGNKKQLTRAAYGIEDAKNLERRLEQKIKEEQEMPTKRMTVKQLYDEYIVMKKYEVREVTLYRKKSVFKNHILPMLENARIDKLSVKTLQDWKIYIEEKGLGLVAKKTIYKEFAAILNYAVKMEYMPKNPLSKIGNFKDPLFMKRKVNFYTPEEFRQYIDIAEKIALEKEQTENNRYEWNFYVFFNIAFYTGLRKGEIHALRWSDIDGDYLTVERSLTQKFDRKDMETVPKSQSSIRTLQLPLPLIKILNEHKERQKQLTSFSEDNRILGNERSVRDSSIQNRNCFYSSLAEVKTIRIHDFRHSHASLLVNMGINIQEVARRLGHSKIEITWNTYAHLYPKEEEKAIAILNAI